MAVNETLSGYSTTAASNTPAGTDNVGPDLDNHIRNLKQQTKISHTHSIDQTAENIRGALHSDPSASPVVKLSYQDGSDEIPLFNIDESANTVTPYVDGVAMPDYAKSLVKEESTASALIRLGTSQVARDFLTATSTAALHDVIGVGTVAGELIELITGSATSIAALPTVSMENVAATQVEMESAISTAKIVVPARQHFHQSSMKGWIQWNMTGTPAINVSYNVTSLTDNGVGDATITWDVDFSTSDYAVAGCAQTGSAPTGNINAIALVEQTGQTAGTVDIICGNPNTQNRVDLPAVHLLAAGDQ